MKQEALQTLLNRRIALVKQLHKLNNDIDNALSMRHVQAAVEKYYNVETSVRDEMDGPDVPHISRQFTTHKVKSFEICNVTKEHTILHIVLDDYSNCFLKIPAMINSSRKNNWYQQLDVEAREYMSELRDVYLILINKKMLSQSELNAVRRRAKYDILKKEFGNGE